MSNYNHLEASRYRHSCCGSCRRERARQRQRLVDGSQRQRRNCLLSLYPSTCKWSYISTHPIISHIHDVEINALSFNRVKLLEIKYTIRVSLNAGLLLGDVDVILPIKIVNFLSIDPPRSTLSGPPEEISRQISMRSYISSTTCSKEVSLAQNGRSTSNCTNHAERAGYFAETCLPGLIRGSKSNPGPAKGSRPEPEYDKGNEYNTDHCLPDSGPQLKRELKSDTVGRAGYKVDSGYCPLTRPRVLGIAPKNSQRRKNDPTSFDLLVQEKLRALVSNAEQVEDGSKYPSAGEVQQPTPDPPNDEYIKAQIKFAKSSREDFGTALPSHKFPQPPIMVQKPIVRTSLIDPGPVPLPSSSVLDSGRGPAILKRSHAQMSLTSGETLYHE